MSHLAKAIDSRVVCMERPFSCFDFVEQHFLGSPPIRRLFSTGRSRGAVSLLIERVPADGTVQEENEDLTLIDAGFRHLEVVRISFWRKALRVEELATVNPEDCIGYALLKKDRLTRKDPDTGSEFPSDEWHVYEAVIRPYPHDHNYATAQATFEFNVAGKHVEVAGCLFAQQNGVNKTCAQVAIRSLATTYFGSNVLSYRAINQLAAVGSSSFDPSLGLTNRQISLTLEGLGIPHFTVDYYEVENDPDSDRRIPTIREDLPYQKLLYSGIESGSGALMAFNLSGPEAPPEVGHLIPYFGHTFNENAWVPNAEPAYFRIGENIAYIPSRSWLSSFLVHDDNFGANFCIPQGFLTKEQVSCVFELLPDGWCYSGVQAEFSAADYFYSILPNAPASKKLPWLKRLRDYVNVKKQKLILRHVSITWTDYLQELGRRKDWEGNTESPDLIAELRTKGAPEQLWMVEVSVPEVFPTNKRKLGEILLDASREISPEIDGNSFVLARLPGYLVFFDSLDLKGVPSFTFTPTSLKSHIRVYGKGATSSK